MTASLNPTYRATDTPHRKIAAIGTFDGVHRGHRFLIDLLQREGRERGLKPVAITFSGHPLAVIAPDRVPPRLLPLGRRCEMLCEAGAEEVIILNFTQEMSALTAAEFMAMLRKDYGVDAMVLGFNNRIGSDGPYTVEEYRRIGHAAGVEVIGATEYQGEGAPVSSSIIRSLIEEGNVAEAAAKLGHRHTIGGTVIHGKQLGRTIGFPTANIAPADSGIALPAHGVYAAWAVTPAGRYPAMVNIGHRPTVDSADAPVSIEAHLIDYTGDLYGTLIDIEFADRLRPERRFSSIEELSAQLQADRAAAIARL